MEKPQFLKPKNPNWTNSKVKWSQSRFWCLHSTTVLRQPACDSNYSQYHDIFTNSNIHPLFQLCNKTNLKGKQKIKTVSHQRVIHAKTEEWTNLKVVFRYRMRRRIPTDPLDDGYWSFGFFSNYPFPESKDKIPEEIIEKVLLKTEKNTQLSKN